MATSADFEASSSACSTKLVRNAMDDTSSNVISSRYVVTSVYVEIYLARTRLNTRRRDLLLKDFEMSCLIVAYLTDPIVGSV